VPGGVLRCKVVDFAGLTSSKRFFGLMLRCKVVDFTGPSVHLAILQYLGWSMVL